MVLCETSPVSREGKTTLLTRLFRVSAVCEGEPTSRRWVLPARTPTLARLRGVRLHRVGGRIGRILILGAKGYGTPLSDSADSFHDFSTWLYSVTDCL